MHHRAAMSYVSCSQCPFLKKHPYPALTEPFSSKLENQGAKQSPLLLSQSPVKTTHQKTNLALVCEHNLTPWEEEYNLCFTDHIGLQSSQQTYLQLNAIYWLPVSCCQGWGAPGHCQHCPCITRGSNLHAKSDGQHPGSRAAGGHWC